MSKLALTLLLLALASAFPAAQASQTNDAQESLNLAVVGKASSSFVSGDTNVGALQNGRTPKNSKDRHGGAYGNWPRRGTQWVQYEWAHPISTDGIEVYWWNDHKGVNVPSACRILYWNGVSFVAVDNPVGLGVEDGQFNKTTFDALRTLKLRLEIVSGKDHSTGILQWRVHDTGESPAFPPGVTAGGDRTVMVGGKTYLQGKLNVLGNADGSRTQVRWSKLQGPGAVAFDEESALATTATFSKPGKYVLALTAGKAPLTGSSQLTVDVQPRPTPDHLHPVDTGLYQIDSPLWDSRAKALIVNWIPYCIEKISDPDLKQGGINNLIDAANKMAGKPHSGHRGYVFSNAWIYNTVESICVALMVDPRGDKEIINAQAGMQLALDEWIPSILAAQEPDGYLQTFFTINDHEHWVPKHRHAHEGYVAGYLLEAAVSHYMLTEGKDKRLYNAGKRLADCWYRNIGPAPKKPWYNGHQAMEMGLVRFGRFVNDVEGGDQGKNYIELAKFLLDCRTGGSQYDQSHVPVTQQYEAVGHAVRAVYSYAGMADVCMETGDIDYQSAVASIWDNIVNKKYYVTGGVGSGETSEGFGPNYSLRHNAYCEACSSCGEIYFQHKLNMTHHDAKYADLYEETLYNALLGSVDLEGKNFFYQNPLDTGNNRYDWHGCPCCIGNFPRVLLMLPTWTYSTGKDSLYVNLFVGSTVTVADVAGIDVEMVQKTDYPWSGAVSITVNPSQEKEFSIHIRKPNRDVSELYHGVPECDGIGTITINGKAVQAQSSPATGTLESGYAVLTRRWKAGDKIEFQLPMKIQRVTASEKIASTLGRTALRYGPLMYCVESVDQDIEQEFDPKAPLTTEWRAELLDGVMVIKGKWADGSELTAIPYYARANRAPAGGPAARSKVWMRTAGE